MVVLFLLFAVTAGTRTVFKCDFERDWCQLENLAGADFLIDENQGRTLTALTGPVFDHTTRSKDGYYIHSECTRLPKSGQTGGVQTAPLHCADGSGTVSFWLNSYGQDASTFNVYLRSAETQKRIERFGPLEHTVEQAWFYHQFDFDLATENFVAVFEFTCGGLKGDIALDDIHITCGNGKQNDQEHRTELANPNEIRDQVGNECQGELVESMSCSFDDSTLCGWRGENIYFGVGETFTFNTGPTEAHSPESYVYMEASEHDQANDPSELKTLNQAKLISPPIPAGTSICLSFYYFLNGVDIDSLALFVNKRLTWRDARNDFTQWQRAEVSIDFVEGSVLMFSLRGAGIYSDIALDSISVTQCACSQRDNHYTGLECSFGAMKQCSYALVRGVELETDSLLVYSNALVKSNFIAQPKARCARIKYRTFRDDILVELRLNGKYGGGDLIWRTTLNTNGAWETEEFIIPGRSEPFCLELVTYGGIKRDTVVEMELAEIKLIDSCVRDLSCEFEADTCDMTLRTHERATYLPIMRTDLAEFEKDRTARVDQALFLRSWEKLTGRTSKSGCFSVLHNSRGPIGIKNNDKFITTATVMKPTLHQLDRFNVERGTVSVVSGLSAQILKTTFSSGTCEQCCEDPFGQGDNEKFRCLSGGCIPAQRRCNGHIDCDDASDEANCEIRQTCGESQIKTVVDNSGIHLFGNWKVQLKLSGLATKHAEPNALPWQVLLDIEDNNGKLIICSGTLIEQQWVLTAAHCVADVKNIKIILGEHDRSRKEPSELVVDASRIIIHPEYDADSFHLNDIGLMKLSKVVPFNDAIQRACWKDGDITVPAAQSHCYLAGWGGTETSDSSSVLLYGKVTQVNRHACEKAWKRKLPEHVTCAGTTSQVLACRGDSGSALVCVDSNGKHRVKGVTSWGEAHCDKHRTRPTIFTKLELYENWIKETINSNVECD